MRHADHSDPVGRRIVERAADAIGDLLDLFLARGIDRLSLVGGLSDAIAPWLAPDLRARLKGPDADARPARCWSRDGSSSCLRGNVIMNRVRDSTFKDAWINQMATEEVDPRFTDLDGWSLTSAMEAMWEGQLAAVAAIGHALSAITAATEAASTSLGDRGRIVYVGAGTSGRVAVQDGAELMPTFAWPKERVRFIVAGGDSAFVTSIEGAEDDTDDAVDSRIESTACTPTKPN